jgi:transposase
MNISTIGFDLAKNVFQVHGVDEAGEVVVRRQLRRGQVIPFFAGLDPCLVGMEACGSAHYWARELAALGHEVRLIPPSYVKPYVRRQKNDAADAAAICEAVTRPSMRFVPVKGVEAQTVLVLHRTRSLLVKSRTMLVNALRAHLAEFGHVAPQGPAGLSRLVELIDQPASAGEPAGVPAAALPALTSLTDQIATLGERIGEIERAIRVEHAASQSSRRLASVPGIGPIIASALAATVPDPAVFRSGREFAAWLGLTPRQNSSGGKQRLGPISKKGDRYLRTLLVLGATALLRRRDGLSPGHRAWLEKLLASKPARLVTVALANKLARIAWAVLAHGDTYRADRTVAAAA